MTWVSAGVAVAGAVYQGVKGIRQKNQAKKLRESKFVPQELLMNRDLAMQQAYSRRAPGQAAAEENVRRTMANRIAGAQKSFGGDANKMAAVASGAAGQANDANARLAAQGAQFSEGAFNRLSNANIGIAGQKRQNRSEYIQTKNALQASGDQNIYNSINNMSTAALAGINSGGFDGIGSETRGAANSLIKQGKETLGSPTAGMGLSLINEGKGMKKAARKELAKSQRGGWNDYLTRRTNDARYNFDPITGERIN